MAFSVNCPNCDAKLNSKTPIAGGIKVSCPRCRRPFETPAPVVLAALPFDENPANPAPVDEVFEAEFVPDGIAPPGVPAPIYTPAAGPENDFSFGDEPAASPRDRKRSDDRDDRGSRNDRKRRDDRDDRDSTDRRSAKSAKGIAPTTAGPENDFSFGDDAEQAPAPRDRKRKDDRGDRDERTSTDRRSATPAANVAPTSAGPEGDFSFGGGILSAPDEQNEPRGERRDDPDDRGSSRSRRKGKGYSRDRDRDDDAHDGDDRDRDDGPKYGRNRAKKNGRKKFPLILALVGLLVLVGVGLLVAFVVWPAIFGGGGSADSTMTAFIPADSAMVSYVNLDKVDQETAKIEATFVKDGIAPKKLGFQSGDVAQLMTARKSGAMTESWDTLVIKTRTPVDREQISRAIGGKETTVGSAKYIKAPDLCAAVPSAKVLVFCKREATMTDLLNGKGGPTGTLKNAISRADGDGWVVLSGDVADFLGAILIGSFKDGIDAKGPRNPKGPRKTVNWLMMSAKNSGNMVDARIEIDFVDRPTADSAMKNLQAQQAAKNNKETIFGSGEISDLSQNGTTITIRGRMKKSDTNPLSNLF